MDKGRVSKKWEEKWDEDAAKRNHVKLPTSLSKGERFKVTLG